MTQRREGAGCFCSLGQPRAEGGSGDQSWALLCHLLVMTLVMQFDFGDAV